MQKLVFSLLIIVVGLALGIIFKRAYIAKNGNIKSPKIIEITRKIAFLGINPLIMVGAFWGIKIVDARLIFLPFICIAALVVGGLLGIMYSKFFKHNRQQMGGMFAVSSFSNLGTIGGLLCFSFLGEAGFTVSAMYVLFEAFYNYLVGYPVCKFFAEGKNTTSHKDWYKKLLDPTIIIYIGSVIIGLSLKFLNVQRPEFYANFNEIGIPTVSFLLIFCLGFEIKLSKIKNYAKECAAVVSIKYLFIPIIVTSLGLLLGINKISDVVFKALIIMSFAPSGFNSIIAPTIYDIDKDLCNSCWLTTMAGLVIVAPTLYLIVNFLV